MNKRIILTGLSLVLFQSAFSQQIHGTLVDEKNAPVAYATISLKTQADSVFVKGELTDEQGTFAFISVPEGTYFVETQVIGFQKLRNTNVQVHAGQTTELGTISLKPVAQNLKNVTVIAEKPFIERKLDKTIVNIEGSSVYTNSSILEMLEKLPGILVSQDGIISLKGKAYVTVMIDGKPTGLSGQDLGNMLKGMSSSQVQKVEIITNPGAQYDAAGNGGIIHIITKKNKAPGLNGSVSAGYGQGRYPKYNSAISLGYKNKWLNVYASYSYSHRKGFNNLMLKRYFHANDTLTEWYDTDNYIVYPVVTHTPRLGADFTLSSKTVLSVLGSGMSNEYNPTADNHTDIYDGNNLKTRMFDFTNRSSNQWTNYSINTELRHQFDTAGRELTVDLDYADYKNGANEYFTNRTSDAGGSMLSETLLQGDQKGAFNIKSVKADYVHPLNPKSKIEAGVKSSFVNSESNIRFYDFIGSAYEFDTGRSNHFLYSENIYAAYVNYNREFNKFSTALGLRAEQTIADGKQLLTGSTFHRNYVQLFPTLFADYKINENNSVNLSLGRRVDRPDYEQMDPFRRMIDATTYAEGNPLLVPQISYNSELSYSHAGTWFITFSYSRTVDNITDVLVQDAVKKVTVQTVDNLASFDFYSLNINFSKKVFKWWTTNTNILSYYGNYQGVINNFLVQAAYPSFNFNTANSLNLGDGFSMEANFQYNYRNLYAVTLMYETSNLTLGLQKRVGKHLNVTLNASDIFWNAWPSGHTAFGGVDEFWVSRRETRVANINLSYRFGNGQPIKMRRNTGADDEKRRVGSGS